MMALMSGFSYDEDAEAFMIATGVPDDDTVFYAATAYEITGNGLWLALNQFVLDLKGFGLWDLFTVLFPFIGGDATTHRIDLKDPTNLGTFSGGFTHDGGGMTPNGINAEFLSTVIDNTLSEQNASYTLYSRTDDIGLFSDFGHLNSGETQFLTRHVDANLYSDFPRGANDRLSVANPDSLGLYHVNSGATNLIAYKNGVQIAAKGSPAVDAWTNMQFIFCNGIINRYSPRNLALAGIGLNFDATQSADFYTAVNTFQTTLNRNV